MKNIKLEIMYDGRNYFGMQIQPNKLTIQGEIEKALKDLFKSEIKLNYAGRTDRGVSAYKMVANFFVDTKIEAEKIALALNPLLPDDIKVLSSESVGEDFNARFSAKYKTYMYKFYSSKITLPLFLSETQIKGELNFTKMKKAAKFLIGTHDFTSFANPDTQIEDKVRTIKQIKILRENIDGVWHYSVFITGNGFLYNMVRIIVGTLIQVGEGKIKPEEIKTILKLKDRTKAGKSMPPESLYLINVKY